MKPASPLIGAITLLVLAGIPPNKPLLPPPHTPQFKAPAGFDTAAAMELVYHDYDPAKQVSRSRVGNKVPKNSFFKAGENIHVRPYFAGTVQEGGTEKIFLVTYAVPGEEHFDCHVCEPLVGMAVFVKSLNEWAAESSRGDLVVAGQWGSPPAAQIVQIGPDRSAIELRDTGGGGGEVTSIAYLLVPWKHSIVVSFIGTVAHSDRGACGNGGVSCFANHKDITFLAGRNPDYFDMVLTRSGTEFAEGSVERVVKVHRVERRQFLNGRYDGQPRM